MSMFLMPRIYRVIVPVGDIRQAAVFYGVLLHLEGRQVSPGRYYYDCSGVILACYDAKADGDTPRPFIPNPDHIYLSVPDLEKQYARAQEAGAERLTPIEKQPWGERSFYCTDPWGNPLCFVDDQTVFRG